MRESKTKPAENFEVHHSPQSGNIAHLCKLQLDILLTHARNEWTVCIWLYTILHICGRPKEESDDNEDANGDPEEPLKVLYTASKFVHRALLPAQADNRCLTQDWRSEGLNQ